MKHRYEESEKWQRVAGPTFALVLLLIATSGLAMARSGSRSRDGDATVISEFIARHESRENGIENAANLRTTMAGDLNHDGVSDLALLYTLEGQNGTSNYVQHLAVFLRLKGRLVPVADAIVGGKTYRSAQIASIKNNVIFLRILNFAENDPSCCPSLKGATRYELEGNKLKELPRK